jgi:hypothetical protein
MAQLFDIDDGLREATAHARREAARLGHVTRTEVAAADPTGAVSVTVRADGAVVAVALHDQWRTRSAGDLSAAVVAALGAAQQAAAEAWSQALATNESDVDVDEPVTEGQPERPGDPAEFARELNGLLMLVEEQLGDLPRLAAEAAERTVEVAGPAGGITAVARQGTLIRLDCDDRWLSEAPRSRVGAELSAALTKALPGLRRQVDDAIQVGPVGELMDLAADPAVLFRRLGLTN